jgi:hypothetical protein
LRDSFIAARSRSGKLATSGRVRTPAFAARRVQLGHAPLVRFLVLMVMSQVGQDPRSG